eukprot:CAMPEP_0206519008 /NCGR_PEP_ID=MMETSP0324_2-20121206/64900_1 /ASSEMBLY_ACC=CAM_ASM_000836 /TAXON_ID=2866 /ORGANISM="Crypthecodinium cohnii, Strain Seligo" /LENGTH=58 /DNA_ID=CAMNT_0054012437 /DNA_START=1 /DNA_END=177 /DNA_ORIENTATION=-
MACREIPQFQQFWRSPRKKLGKIFNVGGNVGRGRGQEGGQQGSGRLWGGEDDRQHRWN